MLSRAGMRLAAVARVSLARLATAAPPRLAVRVRSLCSDSDFQPKRKAFAPDGDVRSQIQMEIDSNKVVVFMKGVPEAPMCGFSNTVVQVLPAAAIIRFHCGCGT